MQMMMMILLRTHGLSPIYCDVKHLNSLTSNTYLRWRTRPNRALSVAFYLVSGEAVDLYPMYVNERIMNISNQFPFHHIIITIQSELYLSGELALLLYSKTA